MEEVQWAADDLRRAFVAGVAWWEVLQNGGTIWSSDRDLAEQEAEKRYPGGKPPRTGQVTTPKNVWYDRAMAAEAKLRQLGFAPDNTHGSKAE